MTAVNPTVPPPKILVWDVETSPTIAATWGLWDQSIPIHHILNEWYIISASWKWLGEDEVFSVSVLDDEIAFKENFDNDLIVMQTLLQVFYQADAMVHHYGDNFDIKKFNTRLIGHGLRPIPDVPQIDTHKIAKTKFKFLSNKLDYIAKFLGHQGKTETTKGLWMRCLAGNKEAIKEMVKYNEDDVIVLENIYKDLAPYAQEAQRKLNFNLFSNNHVCPNCGSSNIIRQGYRRTRVNVQARFQCKDCGRWSSAPIKANGDYGIVR